MKENIIKETKQKIFFPNLDGLRFICFLLVYLYHWNLNCALAIENTSVRNSFNFLFGNGNIGVNIFFVLSGFLITFLLIKEKEFSGGVHLKHFYVRRILRIWPLYFLIVVISFFIIPILYSSVSESGVKSSNFLFYLIFAANFDLIRIWPQLPDVLPIVVLWSVSVEEQFYIVWPIVLKMISKSYLQYVFLLIVLLSLIFRSIYSGPTDDDYAMRYFNTFSVIGDMAIGGLLAYYCSFKSRLLSSIENLHKIQIIVLYIITICFILFRKEIFSNEFLIIIERVIYAVLFAFIIAEQSFSKNSFFKFSSFKIMSKLGIYTYGLYCLQFFSILIIQKLFLKIGWGLGGSYTNVFACLLSLILLIIISMLSYHYFEKYFLNLKKRFSIITK